MFLKRRDKSLIIDTDYKYLKNGRRVSNRQRRLPLALAIGLIGLTVGLAAVTFTVGAWMKPAVVEKVRPLELPPNSNDSSSGSLSDSDLDQQTKTLTIQTGDNLTQLLEQQGVDRRTVHKIVRSGKAASHLRRLVPGKLLQATFNMEGELAQLQYNVDDGNTLLIRRSEQGEYEADLIKKEFETRVVFASGHIESSLFEAGQKANVSDTIIMKMAHVFGWDIDFALDIRQGDSFYLLYEQHYHNGEKIRDGEILAAEFINQGKTYTAISFTDDKGRTRLYDAKGRSLRKAFIRTPVKFSRISSRFSRGRYHPILNRIRAHRGVDYAAPRGTPIRATGNGRVIFRGRKGGYGNTIIVQHGKRYTTLYAHMLRYHRRAKRGARVRQGQIIGYVGSSGLATGPHLHYEFRIKGRHVDPLKVKLARAEPIPKKYREAFFNQRDRYLAQIEAIKTNSVAALTSL